MPRPIKPRATVWCSRVGVDTGESVREIEDLLAKNTEYIYVTKATTGLRVVLARKYISCVEAYI